MYSVWRSDVKTSTDYVFLYNDQNVSTTCQASFNTSKRLILTFSMHGLVHRDRFCSTLDQDPALMFPSLYKQTGP